MFKKNLGLRNEALTRVKSLGHNQLKKVSILARICARVNTYIFKPHYWENYVRERRYLFDIDNLTYSQINL